MLDNSIFGHHQFHEKFSLLILPLKSKRKVEGQIASDHCSCFLFLSFYVGCHLKMPKKNKILSFVCRDHLFILTPYLLIVWHHSLHWPNNKYFFYKSKSSLIYPRDDDRTLLVHIHFHIWHIFSRFLSFLMNKKNGSDLAFIVECIIRFDSSIDRSIHRKDERCEIVVMAIIIFSLNTSQGGNSRLFD